LPKTDLLFKNVIPAEIAVKSDNGRIVPYDKRQAVNLFFLWYVPHRSTCLNRMLFPQRLPSNQTMVVLSLTTSVKLWVLFIFAFSETDLFLKDVIPAEIAVKSDNGRIVPYDKRQAVGIVHLRLFRD